MICPKCASNSTHPSYEILHMSGKTMLRIELYYKYNNNNNNNYNKQIFIDFACSDEAGVWRNGQQRFADFVPPRSTVVQATFLIYGRFDCKDKGQSSMDLLFNQIIVVCLFIDLLIFVFVIFFVVTFFGF
jgi:hypothetical protein